jgi:hypothetical protein
MLSSSTIAAREISALSRGVLSMIGEDWQNANSTAEMSCANEPAGTRTQDLRINLPHGLSPATVVLRSGLYHLPRGVAWEPLVKSLRIPAEAGLSC